jgi:hypothetical protein
MAGVLPQTLRMSAATGEHGKGRGNMPTTGIAVVIALSFGCVAGLVIVQCFPVFVPLPSRIGGL